MLNASLGCIWKSMNFAWNSKPFRSRIEVQRRTSSENYLRNYIKTWLKNTRIKLWNEVNFTSKFLFSSSTVFTMFLLPQQTTSHTSLCKQNEERLFNTFVNLDWQKVVGFFCLFVNTRDMGFTKELAISFITLLSSSSTRSFLQAKDGERKM